MDMDSYYEVCTDTKYGIGVVDYSWDLEEAEELAADYSERHPDVDVIIIEYKEVGTIQTYFGGRRRK